LTIGINPPWWMPIPFKRNLFNI